MVGLAKTYVYKWFLWVLFAEIQDASISQQPHSLVCRRQDELPRNIELFTGYMGSPIRPITKLMGRTCMTQRLSRLARIAPM